MDDSQHDQPVDGHGRFTNLDGSVPQTMRTVLRWAVWDKLRGARRRSPRQAPVPHVTPRLEQLTRAPAAGQPARLTWLGHASWLVQLDGVSLLVDPVLSNTIQGVVKRNGHPPIAPGDLPHVDAQLVTHSHYDHLDLPTVRAVRAPVVAGLGIKQVIAKAGLPATELGWWKTTRVGPVTITFVPAQHWSRRGPADANRTLWGGFVVEGTTARLYHAGDTAWFPAFEEIGRRFPRLDAAMLPIGAYDPGWFMERQHMNPEQAVQAFLQLGSRRLFPMHWGTFKLSDEPLDEPPQRVVAEWQRRGLPKDDLHLLAVGETVELSGGQ